MANRLAQDVRYGVRALARAPGFTAIALVVLSLGIGANATIFSFANAFFLRPLPVSDPGSIVRVCSNRYSTTGQRSYLEYRDRNSTLSGLAAFQMKSFGLLIDRETEHVFGEIVSGEYFSTVGIAPARGRLLQPGDDRAGASPVVVLSHAFWTRRFGAAPDAIGRTIRLNDQPFQVVGVAAQDFSGLMTPLRGDLWVPLAADAYLRPALDAQARLDSTSLHLVGRLKPDVDRARAQADLDTIGRQLRAAGQPGSGTTVSVYSGTTLHPEIAPPVTAFTAVLMAVVGLVLLIVCVNVANLVLARAAGRSLELAIRQALGAGRGRLLRQLLTESLLLSSAGAVGGLAISYWATRLLAAVQLPAPVPLALDLAIDVRVLAFTTLVAVMTSLAFGLAPALTASRVDLVGALKGSAGEGRGHGRLRAGFLVAQVSMSVLLLIAAGLFIRGFRNARSFDLGFDTDRVLTASVDLETRGYNEATGREFVRAIVERLGAAPGVVGVNALDIVPVTLSNRTGQMIREGDPEPGPDRPPLPNVYLNAVGPGHFRTLRIGMAAGRDFTEQDGASATNVAIVNETLARRYWPESSALGKRLRPLGAPDRVLEVVGVVRDSKYVTVDEEPRPFVYRPLAQAYTPHVTLLVRTSGTSADALRAIKETVKAQDPGLAVFNVATLADATALALLPAQVAGNLLGALGVLALLLAALGIYGVLSYIVRSRTREIGVRIAIGATPQAVAFMVVRQSLKWSVVGLSIGLISAGLLTRLLQRFLYGISPTDPLTFGMVTLLLVFVASAAALIPAVRASRLDPIVALKDL
jgi:putative ABC transport system permease protein